MASLLSTTINGDLQIINNSVNLRFNTSSGSSTGIRAVNPSNTGTKVSLYLNDSTYINSSGNIYSPAFYATSDRRLKENIKKIDLDPLQVINSLKLKEFNFKSQDDKENKYIGLMAQDVRDVLPEKYKKCFVNGEETLAINEGKLPYLTLGAVQQMSKKVDKLEKENEELKKRLSKLEKLVERLS